MMNKNESESYRKLRTLYEKKFLKESEYIQYNGFRNSIKYHQNPSVKKKFTEIHMWVKDIKIIPQQSKTQSQNNYFLQKDEHSSTISPNSKIIRLENGEGFHISYEYMNKNKRFTRPKARVYSETRSVSTNMQNDSKKATNYSHFFPMTQRVGNLDKSFINFSPVKKYSLIELIKQSKDVTGKTQQSQRQKHRLQTYQSRTIKTQRQSPQVNGLNSLSKNKIKYYQKLKGKNNPSSNKTKQNAPVKIQLNSFKDCPIDPWIVTDLE